MPKPTPAETNLDEGEKETPRTHIFLAGDELTR
jgi:hypothetical protein